MTSQRQDSLYSQLHTVYALAIREGCYDAADFIRGQIDSIRERLHEVNGPRCSLCKDCLCCTPTMTCPIGGIHA